MAFLRTILCTSLAFLQLVAAQPTPLYPPKLSNSFSSKITILNSGSEVTSEMFVDYGLNKSLQITNLGTEGAAKVYLLTIGEEKKTYRYLEPFDYCTIDPEPGVVAPMWSWLDQNHAYCREQVFFYKGELVAVFQTYENYYNTTGVMKEAAFSGPGSDLKTPVYFVSSTGDGPMIFEDYKNSTPPESMFTIPESCKKKPLPTIPLPLTNSLDFLKMLRTLN